MGPSLTKRLFTNTSVKIKSLIQMKSIKLIKLFDYIIKFCTMHNKNNINSFYCNKHIYNRESKKIKSVLL